MLYLTFLVRLSNRSRTSRLIMILSIPRVPGKSAAKPTRSVKKPGVKSRRPPISIKKPSKISSPGKFAPATDRCRRRNAVKPWLRASAAPAAPVVRTATIVGIVPSNCPIWIRRASSRTGVTVNIKKSRKNIIVRNIHGSKNPVEERLSLLGAVLLRTVVV